MKYKDLYIHHAYQIAAYSHCPDRKVGCVITKDDRPISNGYNGRLPGDDNRCIDDNGQTLSDVVHAEANAIQWAVENGFYGDTMYVTLAPCLDCAKLIVSYGIKTLHYAEIWPKSNDGLDYLFNSGVEVDNV